MKTSLGHKGEQALPGVLKQGSSQEVTGQGAVAEACWHNPGLIHTYRKAGHHCGGGSAHAGPTSLKVTARPVYPVDLSHPRPVTARVVFTGKEIATSGAQQE